MLYRLITFRPKYCELGTGKNIRAHHWIRNDEISPFLVLGEKKTLNSTFDSPPSDFSIFNFWEKHKKLFKPQKFVRSKHRKKSPTMHTSYLGPRRLKKHFLPKFGLGLGIYTHAQTLDVQALKKQKVEKKSTSTHSISKITSKMSSPSKIG